MKARTTAALRSLLTLAALLPTGWTFGCAHTPDVTRLQQEGDVDELIRVMDMNGSAMSTHEVFDDNRVRESAAKALSQIGGPAVPALIRTLKANPHRATRLLAAYAGKRRSSSGRPGPSKPRAVTACAS
jgi:HEAT repeat protein